MDDLEQKLKKKNRFRKYVRSIIGFLGLFYIANVASSIPIDYFYLQKKAEQSQPTITINKKTESFFHFSKYDFPYENENPSLEEKTIGWLKYANMIAETIQDYEMTDGLDLERSFKKGEGDCDEYAALTYSMFVVLSTKTECPKMRNLVRLAEGLSYSKHIKGWVCHAWVELYSNGKWIPWETTALTIKNGKKIDPSMTLDIDVEELLKRDSSAYYRTGTVHVKLDMQAYIDIEIINSLIDVKGHIRNWWNFRKLEKILEGSLQ
ncbi:hypothetical protein GOV06_02785 [Candidatus Woesearchaeota archaeon]|nr:hypothetical protein [Candidatus Woesearchaeota archaeon]